MRTIITLVFILVQAAAMAQSPDCEDASAPVLLLQGYAAPFPGWLLSPCRAANMAAKIEALEKLVQLEKDKAAEEVQALEWALSDTVLDSMKAVATASERSWWESHTTEIGIIGVGLGVVLGTLGYFLVDSAF